MTTVQANQLFTLFKPPYAPWKAAWESLYLAPELWRRLENYIYLLVTGQVHQYPTASKLVILFGYSGTGKTTLAKGIANQTAHQWEGSTQCFWVNAESWRDSHLGNSAKAVKRAFDSVAMAARHGNVILIIDELEAIAISRQRTLNTDEPSDVITAVDVLLNQIDRLQAEHNVLIIATSNLGYAIDSALINRADLCIPFDLPNLEARTHILRQAILPLRENGHSLSDEDVMTLGEATQGLSGRQLVKLPMLARLEKEDVRQPLNVEDYLQAIQIQQTEQTFSEK